jgi:hypothetical protein
MGEKLDEGLLFDLLEKRRAGKFTGDELLWAADHPEVIRWAMGRPAVAAAIQRGVREGRPGFGSRCTKWPAGAASSHTASDSRPSR